MDNLMVIRVVTVSCPEFQQTVQSLIDIHHIFSVALYSSIGRILNRYELLPAVKGHSIQDSDGNVPSDACPLLERAHDHKGRLQHQRGGAFKRCDLRGQC